MAGFSWARIHGGERWITKSQARPDTILSFLTVSLTTPLCLFSRWPQGTCFLHGSLLLPKDLYPAPHLRPKATPATLEGFSLCWGPDSSLFLDAQMFIFVDVQNYNFRLGRNLSLQPSPFIGLEHWAVNFIVSLRTFPVSHSWVIKGKTRILLSLQWPAFPPPQQMIARDRDAYGSPRVSWLAHIVPLKSKRGKRATAFSRNHFIPLWARLLPPMTFWWHSILATSPESSITSPWCPLFPPFLQFCFPAQVTSWALSGHRALRYVFYHIQS